MEDDQIMKTVESMLGKNIKIIDCEKKSVQHNEEILLINGIPVKLEGDEGNTIKNALLSGNIPSCDLLNKLLINAGILKKSIRLETSLSVKTTTILKEAVTVKKHGKLLDERSSETKEDNLYTSSCSEIWEPIGIINNNNELNINNKKYTKNIVNNDEEININKNNINYNNDNDDDDDDDDDDDNVNNEKKINKKLLNKNSSYSSSSVESNYSISPILSNLSDLSLTTTATTTSTTETETTTTGNELKINNCIDELITINNKLIDIDQQELNDKQMLTNNMDKIKNKTIINYDDETIENCYNDDDEKINDEEINVCSKINNNLNNKKNQQTISIDSGNDELITESYENNKSDFSNNLIKVNSMSSSCCDFSSTDDIDFIQSLTTTPTNITNNTIKLNTTINNYTKGRPQQLMPTIFGTVASSNQCPKHNGNKKSLPQTVGQGSYSSNKSIIDSHEANQSVEFPESDENALVYRDGNLVSGSLEALIQHMVPTGDYYPDRSYLFAFLLSSRLFIKPHELLEQICRLCELQQQLNNFTNIKNQQDIINLKKFSNQFVQLITEWIETFPYDFRDERVMQYVRQMTQKCVQIETNLCKIVSTLLQNLLQRLTTLDNYEEFLRQLNNGFDIETQFINLSSTTSGITTGTTTTTSSSSTSSIGIGLGSSGSSIIHDPSQYTISSNMNIDLTEMCPSPAHIAHQLTHIELERLYHIGPEEFVQAFAKENPHLKTTFKDMKKTRNLESYVQWFNRLSYFVATEIVKQSKKKQRVRIIEYWIETARECFNIGNFNSLMAIIAGLNMSPILRLKKTWAKIQSAKFSILEHQMDPTSNFNSYRSTLKAAMWRSAGATDERQRIVIPFFSLLVKDLYFLNEGCSNKLPNGHINFEKFWQLAKQVTEFITWKQVTCPFEKNMKIIIYLQTSNVLTENTLAMASFECEPPDNNHEKDRYKTLKSEQNN